MLNWFSILCFTVKFLLAFAPDIDGGASWRLLPPLLHIHQNPSSALWMSRRARGGGVAAGSAAALPPLRNCLSRPRPPSPVKDPRRSARVGRGAAAGCAASSPPTRSRLSPPRLQPCRAGSANVVPAADQRWRAAAPLARSRPSSPHPQSCCAGSTDVAPATARRRAVPDPPPARRCRARHGCDAIKPDVPPPLLHDAGSACPRTATATAPPRRQAINDL
uniref:Uncharacterized protein n=1 Tax=Oryza meridionalis TaxID=40149 RepID=A0A0E0DAH3_9ORYZ